MSACARRFPPWLTKRLPPPGATDGVRRILARLGLHTVCQSAHCPNLCECFARGTATFMILGDVCTRDCRFCAVAHGKPTPPDPEEPGRVAQATAELGLRHVVVTSVTRDDLPDGGASHFAATIAAIREACEATVEVLTPDFQGSREALEVVFAGRPDVFNHNVETIPRLYPLVRPEADFERSLHVLRLASEAGLVTKSGLMVGLGEGEDEVFEVLARLREAGCQMVTIGQYLRPSAAHVPVARFVCPEEFTRYSQEAKALGFAAVASGPFVRSSYHAAETFQALVATARNGDNSGAVRTSTS